MPDTAVPGTAGTPMPDTAVPGTAGTPMPGTAAAGVSMAGAGAAGTGRASGGLDRASSAAPGLSWQQADIGRARRDLGWQPRRSLAASLADLWEECRAPAPG
jgi:nucleoside-diphosphate-sugar epimerase